MSESLFQPVSDGPGEQVPEGIWIVRVRALEPWEPENQQFETTGPQIKWVFTLESAERVARPKPSQDVPNPTPVDDWIGREFWQFSSTSMGPRSKPRHWAEALLDQELPIGQQLSSEALIGKTAEATIGRTDGGRTKITSLRPLGQFDSAGEYVSSGRQPGQAEQAAQVPF